MLMGRAAVIIRGIASKLEVNYSLADAWEQAAREREPGLPPPWARPEAQAAEDPASRGSGTSGAPSAGGRASGAAPSRSASCRPGRRSGSRRGSRGGSNIIRLRFYLFQLPPLLLLFWPPDRRN